MPYEDEVRDWVMILQTDTRLTMSKNHPDPVWSRSLQPSEETWPANTLIVLSLPSLELLFESQGLWYSVIASEQTDSEVMAAECVMGSTSVPARAWVHVTGITFVFHGRPS